jgi:hypothetical protein
LRGRDAEEYVAGLVFFAIEYWRPTRGSKQILTADDADIADKTEKMGWPFLHACHPRNPRFNPP